VRAFLRLAICRFLLFQEPTDFHRDITVDRLTDIVLRFSMPSSPIVRAVTDIPFDLSVSAGF
jgi:hypothetical protein